MFLWLETNGAEIDGVPVFSRGISVPPRRRKDFFLFFRVGPPLFKPDVVTWRWEYKQKFLVRSLYKFLNRGGVKSGVAKTMWGYESLA